MPSLPRIITVDPNARIPHLVRNAIDLLDVAAIQIDIPSGKDALEELQNGKCDLVVAAWTAGDNMPGWELAAEVKKAHPDAAIIIIADYEDTELDEDVISSSPFVYLHRPFNAELFLRAVKAGILGEDIFEAIKPPVTQGSSAGNQQSYGPVPNINIKKAEEVVQGLLTDINALAILLASREGDVLLERGAIGFLNREEVTRTLATAANVTIGLKDVVGNTTSMQYYDGDEYDIYVLTVGFHHFMIILFDGRKGSRELGAVRTFGRRASEDLIALLGAEAWLISRAIAEKPKAVEEELPRLRRGARTQRRDEVEEDLVELDRATFAESNTPIPKIEESLPQLDAIEEANFDPDALFNDDIEFDEDIFDLSKMEEIAKMQDDNRQGVIDDEEARRLGLIN